MGLVSRRREVAWLKERFEFSERRACELMGVERSSCRYRAKPAAEDELKEQIVSLARAKPRYGYRRLTAVLRRDGRQVNHKRVHRVCRELRLQVRWKRRRRIVRSRPAPVRLLGANQQWAMDFLSDTVASGRPFRVLTMVDAYTRECLELEVAASIPSQRVTRVLERVAAGRGYPAAIRVDNGPEFTSRHFLSWCEQRGIGVEFIEPGKPTQNAVIESFNGRFRDECLNANWFGNLLDARGKIGPWKWEYNQARPHSALGYRTPAEFAALPGPPAQARPSGFACASAPDSACFPAVLAGESHL
jgi:putative transposase